jgi:IPT/TIG domain
VTSIVDVLKHDPCLLKILWQKSLSPRLKAPAYCIALMQNLSAADQQELGRTVENLARQTMDDDTMALILGLTLMNFVGANVLGSAIVALGGKISRSSPRIQGVTPPSATNAGGTALTISGVNFRASAGVWINNIPCVNVKVTDLTIICDAPSAPGITGAVSMTVANPDGQSDTALDKFSYT